MALPLGRNVLITGASTGIGRATALLLDRRGFRVFAGVRRSQDGDSLRSDGSDRLQPLSIDVADPASIEAAAKQVEQELGDAGLAGLVNNAGIAVVGFQEFLDVAELRRQFDVNVFGLAEVTRAFFPAIRKSRGRIVNISSNGGYVALPAFGPYSSSKFAVEALSDALRREVKPWGIDVSLIEPGAIETEIWSKGEAYADQLRAQYPAEAVDLYGDLMRRVEANAAQSAKRAIPAERVAEAIEHALTAARPRTRYRVGTDAKISRFLSWVLPDRALDFVLDRIIPS